MPFYFSNLILQFAIILPVWLKNRVTISVTKTVATNQSNCPPIVGWISVLKNSPIFDINLFTSIYYIKQYLLHKVFIRMEAYISASHFFESTRSTDSKK